MRRVVARRPDGDLERRPTQAETPAKSEHALTRGTTKLHVPRGKGGGAHPAAIQLTYFNLEFLPLPSTTQENRLGTGHPAALYITFQLKEGRFGVFYLVFFSFGYILVLTFGLLWRSGPP